MRIASLIPAATEILFALGVGDDVVAVSHECDFPLQAQDIPRVTRALLPDGLEAAELDRAVRELSEQGRGLYEIDESRLRALAPDVIVTQGLCDVCAVSLDEVQGMVERMDPAPQIVPLSPTTFGEVIGDVRAVAQATDAKDAGVDMVREVADRVDRVRLGVRDVRPVRVAALEWLEPVYTAGHWIPQLIDYAGGEDVSGMAGQPSEPSSWEELALAGPEVIVVMPCGYDGERAIEEAETYADELAELGARRIVAVDASAFFSRPGPRLVDGLETLAHILHPERFPHAPTPVLEVLL
jgi:iron complex transport system substrate-binding protein